MFCEDELLFKKKAKTQTHIFSKTTFDVHTHIHTELVITIL